MNLAEAWTAARRTMMRAAGKPWLEQQLSRHFGAPNAVEFRLDRTLDEFAAFQRGVSTDRENLLRHYEWQLREHSPLEPLEIPGHCRACGADASFGLDMRYTGSERPNWRERLECSRCHLNHRLRLSVDLFEALNPRGSHCEAYISEQLTAAFRVLGGRCKLTGSEYLGPEIEPGSVVEGVRHEDCTRLSFAGDRFDVVMSFDVLEHIPEPEPALKEFGRVLRRGGVLLLSAPFDTQANSNLRRARPGADGTITHLAPPEYHGDPVHPERGILCYWHFGWELLEQVRRAGFRDAAAFTAWSPDAAYLGPPVPIVLAVKG